MPIIAGYISVQHGWRMQFKLISGFLGPVLLAVILFCPEHAFRRNRKFETDLGSGGSSTSTSVDNSTVAAGGDGKDNVGEKSQEVDHEGGEGKPKKTFLQELKIYNGRFSDDSFWKLLVAPFPCMLYPATIWAFLLQGTFVTWVSTFGIPSFI